MSDTRGTLKGALIGGLVGAAAALLLAPKSGRELRGDIRDKYASVQDRAKRLASDASDKTREIAKTLGNQASEAADKTRSAMAAAKEELQSRNGDAVSGKSGDKSA